MTLCDDQDPLEAVKATLAANRARLEQLIDLSRGYHVALVSILLTLQRSGTLTTDEAWKVLEAALLALPLDRQQSGTANVLMGAVEFLKECRAGDSEAATRKLDTMLGAMLKAIHE